MNEATFSHWSTSVSFLLLLQFGVRMFVITSFKDTCYIEILPHFQKSNRRKLLTIANILSFNPKISDTIDSCVGFWSVICLSFWAEVHYNSIYPEGGMWRFLYDYHLLWILLDQISMTYWSLFFLCSWNCVELPIPEGKKKKKYWVFWALSFFWWRHKVDEVSISISIYLFFFLT